MTRVARSLCCGIWLLLLMVATAPAALADAAGPTDYNTEIISIEPAASSIRVDMIGGDSFVSLEQLEPVEVVILGYQAEPYLRFSTDGTVYENRRSPAVWLNQERYSSEQAPSFASADARPEWYVVATDGRYVWHDHRSHWMSPQQPPGAQPGDQILEGVIPIQIDGEEVTITVASFLLDDPSKLPVVFGVATAALIGVAMGRSARTRRIAVALAVGIAAAVHGIVAFVSVPSETQPSSLLWLLPVVALVAAATVLVIQNITATTVYLDGLTVVAGACTVAWGFSRRLALQRSLIPSDAPAWLDRFVITVALIVGVVVTTHGIIGLLRPQRLRTPNGART